MKRNLTMKKYYVISWMILGLMLPPLWASAEAFRDQPVKMVSWDELAPQAINEQSAVSNEEVDDSDENMSVVAGPMSEKHALTGAASAFDSQHSKPAKMKVLTCHITASTTNMMGTIYPWVETGVKVAHVAHFEIENKSDFVKFKITVQGPEFSTPLTHETITFGPQKPLQLWRIGYMRAYTVPGLYKIKMTAYPETNKTAGKSSAECSFRVSEPTSN
jgi:hypothetical protein